MGTPADIAAVVMLLLSPDAAWLTGQNLVADGGLV
ncbi:SDR family oxidoreductase [Actinomadura namibiensis]